MAPTFLALATNLENLGARRLLAKKVNFVPCIDMNDTGYYPEKNWKSRVCTNIFDREGKVQIVKGKLEVKCD